MDIDESHVYEKLIASGLRFVSYRPRSEKEIRDFLTKKLTRSHISAPLILKKVLERLHALGYIDDGKFASWWVDQRTGRKPKGKKLIERELKQKGIDFEVETDEKLLASRAIQKKLLVYKNLSPLEKKKKLSDFLYRQGFDWETIGNVIDDVFSKE